MEIKTASHLQKLVRSGLSHSRAFSARNSKAASQTATRGPNSGTRGAAAAPRVMPHAADFKPVAHQQWTQPAQKLEKMKPLATGAKLSEEEMLASIFAKDTTPELIKKFFVYKLMGSNLFINYSLGLMNLAYKSLGVRATNFVINKSVGSLFTSGETIQTLVQDIAALEKHNIHGIANYVVEGLAEMDEPLIQKVYDHMLESIHA